MEIDSLCFLTIITKFQSHLALCILHSAFCKTPLPLKVWIYTVFFLIGSETFEVLNYPLPLWGFSGTMKQINLNGKTRLKIPTGRRHTSWAIYKHGCGFELKTTENKSSLQLGQDLNSEPLDYKSIALTARPRCLLTDKDTDWQT